MFAVIKTGGKQYKVAKNDVIKVEKLAGEPGAVILLQEVLAYGEGDKVTLGAPTVADIAVAAEVLEQKKDKKVLVFKKKRRHNYRRLNGHRQQISVLRITDIGSGLKAKDAPAKKEEAPKAEKPKKAEAKAAPAQMDMLSAVDEKVAAKKPAAKKAPAKKEGEAKKPAAKKTTAKKAD